MHAHIQQIVIGKRSLLYPPVSMVVVVVAVFLIVDDIFACNDNDNLLPCSGSVFFFAWPGAQAFRHADNTNRKGSLLTSTK